MDKREIIMKKISRPEVKQEELFNSLVDLKYKDIIMERSKKYENIIANVKVAISEENELIKNNYNFKEHMKKMYGERFSNNKYIEPYKFYSEIRASQTKCPFCNYPTREVKQLDHYLPKAKFPSLALTVNNLVPICKECNEKKGSYFSLSKEKQFIHPYYDYKAEEVFEYLQCEVIEKDPIGFKFKIKKLSEWDDIFYERIKLHFVKLEIDKLYLADFNSEFDAYINELKLLMANDNYKNLVRSLLQIKVQGYYNNKTVPWKYAGFKSVLHNEWFWSVYCLR